eukprot:7694561-Ditylum_brightwellii.AAC.1
MRKAPTSKQQSNPNVKQAVIAFMRPSLRQLERVLKGQNITQGPARYAVAKTLLKGNALTVFKQAEITHGNQAVPNFELCLDGVAKHVFLEKTGQTQKRYMQRNICYGRGTTVKEWVAQVLELNSYLKDFPAHNGNLTQPLDADKILDILEYRVPMSWRREFTVQGFDPGDQGLQKFVEFCTRLESCESNKGKPKGKKPSKPKTAGKRKAKVLTTTTSPAGKIKFYCKMHGQDKTHDTKDYFELKERAKRAKSSTNWNKADR